MINSFTNEYYFLSNYSDSEFVYDGIQYQNAESAFQSQKCANKEDRKQFSKLNSTEARKLGRKVSLRKDWESVKVNEMRKIVKEKFLQNPDLQKKLIETNSEYLEEGNPWGDRLWGTVDGCGANLLGQILMELRDELVLEKQDVKIEPESELEL